MLQVAKRRGFTLIELLVVVVIIGILATIGIGGFNQAMDRSRNGGMISNVRSILLGVEQWKTDHPGLPPELTGNNHNEGIASNSPTGAGDFPVKYVPGARLPVSPWSRIPQTAFQDGFDSAVGKTRPGDDSNDNPLVADKVSDGEVLVVTKEGYFADGGSGPGAPPPPGQAPSLRKHYGYVYYVGDAGAGRFAVLGVGKRKNTADIMAVRTNYQ